MPFSLEIVVEYDDNLGRAEFDCPLCKKHITHPDFVYLIRGEHSVKPEVCVKRHLYCAPIMGYCTGFDPMRLDGIDDVDATRVILRFKGD